MRACAIIPAFQAERTVGAVVRDLFDVWPESSAIFVVDDGSLDGTAAAARAAGARVIVHPGNQGKGAALRTGLRHALEAGFEVAVSVDADAQHPADEAARLLSVDPDPEALVLGVRDLLRDGAPRASQISNRISNFFLSLFARRLLLDTQCGLRRYPIARTLGLAGKDDGYAFEAEIILRAVAAGVRLVEEPVRVYYPPPSERISHFHNVRDPARIIARVLKTLAITRGVRKLTPEPVPPVVRVTDGPAGKAARSRIDSSPTSVPPSAP
jgi:glycosyltransferase involved in cell wall biosynthesis